VSACRHAPTEHACNRTATLCLSDKPNCVTSRQLLWVAKQADSSHAVLCRVVLCRAVLLQLGFTLSLYYLAVWVGCGLTVWKAIGIW
jgi:hypothetical protein